VIDAESIYTVYRWTGEKYALSHHEFCDGVWIEYCNPIIITPIEEAASERLTVARDATYLHSPKASAPRTELQSGTTTTVIGAVPGGDWYLVELWKGESGFVSRRYVRHD